jgi:hypothetical protein
MGGYAEHSEFITDVTPLLNLESPLRYVGYAHCLLSEASCNIVCCWTRFGQFEKELHAHT